jgi:alpha-ketoglutarate-dependent taurine dioxygenase
MSVMDSATLAVRPLSPVTGAEIAGIDLSHPLAPAVKDAIMTAFLAQRVLVFREQRVTADQQHALTLQFGEIEAHVARLPGGDRYLGLHTSHVVGMPEADGRALLARLLAHTTESRFVYAHAWRTGDLVMWDNRCLLHRAVRNYDMARHRRILQRTVVKGTAPF